MISDKFLGPFIASLKVASNEFLKLDLFISDIEVWQSVAPEKMWSHFFAVTIVLSGLRPEIAGPIAIFLLVFSLKVKPMVLGTEYFQKWPKWHVTTYIWAAEVPGSPCRGSPECSPGAVSVQSMPCGMVWIWSTEISHVFDCRSRSSRRWGWPGGTVTGACQQQ